jgi:hypothetical protein
MDCRFNAKDIENGDIPAFTGTNTFRQIFPMNRIKLLEYCNMQNAPVIRNGKKFIIKTAPMIDFIEQNS